jgi:5-methyltetrahydrofolate--homocysteine methyltransferase
MKSKAHLAALLKKKILTLDGAMGTELQKRGMPSGVCPEAWGLEHPAIVRTVHEAYARAGSEIVYTNTFGANRLKLAEYGLVDVRGINRRSAALAREAVGKDVLVAGDIGPTGQFVEPFGPLGFEEAVAIFREQAEGLLEGGVDLFAIETMMDIQEARAALLAVQELGDPFAIVTMTFEREGRTLGGTDPLSALVILQSLGAGAFGCNCSTGPEAMVDILASIKPQATVPLVAKPNAGMPKLSGRKTVYDMTADSFGAFGRAFASAGVNLLGGCCGTTPDHIRALKRAVKSRSPKGPQCPAVAALSSARKTVLLGEKRPLVIVGERINPTGKKALQEELRAGRTTLVCGMARQQEIDGAQLLDVNVGAPGIDETGTMRKIVSELSVLTELPLVIDSARVETIEAALRLYPGRALVNSISGERERMERLLPIAARYGAMFILLPLAGGEVPETAERRKDIILEVFREAKKYGFRKEDIVVDGLVMTVAANPRAAQETLDTVLWCSGRFGCRTILGLSNVSFGLPGRPWLNAAFAAMAQAAGLTLAIANPANRELLDVAGAADVLLERDPGAAGFLARVAGKTGNAPAPPVPAEERSFEQRIRTAVVDGARGEIAMLLDRALESGSDASRIVEEVMVPAIVSVGDLYERRVYFLPQLIAAAEAMKAGLAHLEPRLKKERVGRKAKGSVLIATVRGDIHDIGKNIVALMLRNHGYDVIDMGKDVPAERILEEAGKRRPDVIGLSALMTTTMVSMQEIVERSVKAGLPVSFLVGGAVVTAEYASSIGASYARDGVEAVKVVDALMQARRKA